MKYRDILDDALKKNSLSLRQASELITERSGIKVGFSYLSKLKSGSMPPASDKINEAIAKILNIDPLKLKAAAYKEKIPPEVLKELIDT